MASCKFCHTVDFSSSQFPAAIKKPKKLKTKNKSQKISQIKRKIFENYAHLFSLEKVFIINKNVLLELEEVYNQVQKQLRIFLTNYFEDRLK